jgi:WD40 repeat protein/serine/threonine protein kinase
LEQLESLLEQQLGDGDEHVLALHVSGCGSCQASLERLTTESLSAEFPALSAVRPAPAVPATPSLDSQSVFLAQLKQAVPGAGDRATSGPATTVASPGGSEAPSVPGYEIVGELGRGGMGVVYKARQIGLNRLVALKMILAGSHASPRDLARFRHEAEAVARLRHPNIVQIYDIGESDGAQYFALEYLEEGSLVHKLRGDPQPLLAAARLIETLARTIDFAHQHQIVHRDLKPANVLLVPKPRSSQSDAAEVLEAQLPIADFVPKITDFGLAKRLDEQSSKTQSGEILGTPSYMAPEQAAGKGTLVGPPADVHALGAILYEMLTGRPPFKAGTTLDTVLLVLHEEPVRPGSLRPGLTRDLETICLKCLEKEPRKRYSSAAALADDLERFRRGLPIHARPVGLIERTWKRARHKPLPAALLAGIVLVAMLGFAGITWQWRVALAEKQEKQTQSEQAEEARRQEENQRNRARAALYFSRIAQTQLHWRLNDFVSAENNLSKCVPGPGQEDRRGWEWYYLQGLLHSDLFTLRHDHGGADGAVAVSADGKRIASVVGGYLPEDVSRPGEIRVWDARSGAVLHAFAGPGALNRLAFCSDGARLVVATTDGAVLIWDANTGQEVLRRTPHTQAIAAIASSPDGTHIATASWDKTVKLWDAGTGQVLHELRGHSDKVQSVAYHPDGKRLASGSWDGTVKLWDAEAGKEIVTLPGHKSAVYSVAFSPDGKLLVSAGSNGNLKIWDLATARVVQTMTGHAGAVLSIAFSPDGRYLAYGGGDATVRVWDVESGVERITFRGHAGQVEGVCFSPDGRRLVSFNPAQGEVKVWDLTRHPAHATFARTDSDVEAMVFTESGRRLVTATIGGKLQTWNAATGVLMTERTVAMNKDVISPGVPASFSPTGRTLAARSRDDARLVKTWKVTSGAEEIQFRGHTLPVVCVRFSPDGRLLATAGSGSRKTSDDAGSGSRKTSDDAGSGSRKTSDDDHKGGKYAHELFVWNAGTGDRLATRSGQGNIFNLAFSPDGRWLALGKQDGMIALVDWADAHSPMEFSGHAGDVAALTFSPDGRFLATAGIDDRTVKVWEVEEVISDGASARKAFQTLAAPSLLCDLAFSPNGQRLAAISRDLVKMWEVETGHDVLTLRGATQRHWDPAFNPRVAFSPDGNRLAGTNWDESVSLWEIAPGGDEESLARHQADRRRAADRRAICWHLQEAELCLKHKNPAAAAFHLQRLGDEPLSGPLQRLKEQLMGQLDKK